MAVLVPWNKEEAALLIDAYYRVKRGEIDLHAAVRAVSRSLREMAVRNGTQIDDTYRNEHEIKTQLRTVGLCVAQKPVRLKRDRRTFQDMLALRDSNREAFDAILQRGQGSSCDMGTLREWYREISVKTLGLSVRTRNALRRNGVQNLYSLIEHYRRGDLLSCIYIGKKTMAEIEGFLDRLRLEEAKALLSEENLSEGADRGQRSQHGEDTAHSLPRTWEVPPDAERVCLVVAESFPNGIRPASPSDQNKLRRFYEARFCEPMPESMDAAAILLRFGIAHGDKVYLLTDEQKTKLRDTIQRLFDEGHHVLYYSELCVYHPLLLEECHLYDEALMRSVLSELFPGARCEEECIFSGPEASGVEEVERAFGDDLKLNYAQIKERRPYLTMEAIRRVLTTSKRFVWTQSETYAQEDLVQLDPHEVQQVETIVLPKIQADGYMSLNQLPLQESCALNPGLSFAAVRDTMYRRHMASVCSRKGIVAARYGTRLPTVELLIAYCRSMCHVSVKELKYYAQEELGYSLNLALNVACRCMIRVNRDNFVNDDGIHFDVDAIDRAVSLFVGERIMPITAITSFTSFPDIEGYSWNLYLVESFLRRFSRKYSFGGNPSQGSYVGGIYPRTLHFDRYEDLLASAAIQDNVLIDEEVVGKYLMERRYILRRAPIVKTVCDKALILRAQQGIPGV